MRNRRSKIDMPHALAAHFRGRDFHAAFFADDTAIFHALIFATETFVILDRSENTRAEQTVAFGFERAVVDGFRLFYFAERPAADFLRRRDRDFDFIKLFCCSDRLTEEGSYLFLHRVVLFFNPGAGRDLIFPSIPLLRYEAPAFAGADTIPLSRSTPR